MRRFVIVGHKAVTTGDFKLDDMAGGAGRLDILLRCINSAFFLSHKLRRDVEVFLIMQGPPNPPRTVRLVGNELKYLNPDERSTGALVRNALLQTGEGETRSSPGIYVSNRTFSDVVSELLRHTPGVICLGPISYHADHCIIIMNNELDRRCETGIGDMPESLSR